MLNEAQLNSTIQQFMSRKVKQFPGLRERTKKFSAIHRNRPQDLATRMDSMEQLPYTPKTHQPLFA